jgi:hypothetical protein
MSVSTLPKLADVDAASWTRLAKRRIFFGHQSVGQNIVDGVTEVLAANPKIRLTVVASKDLDATKAAGFYHANVGRNEFPDEKEEEFATIADRAFASAGGVGMVKLCFVDVHADTDPQALFAAYQRRMAELVARRPGLTLVHFTMPLTTVRRSRGYWKKRLLGRTTEEDLNKIRNRYNTLLRAAYQGREPVFDVARLESTRPDGSRAFTVRGTDTVYMLAEQYTNDDGHLTAAPRRMVAEQLLIFLAQLPLPDHY